MRRPVAISEFVEQAVEMYQPQIDHLRQSLTVELPPEPVYVDGDPLRLAQVFGNLLHNASKYTHEKGAISLTGRIEGEIVALYVKDNGCGISAAALPTVFDLFTQDDASLSRTQGGLGIGLAVVRSMVDLLDGTVEAHSDGIGKGSEFVVRLPLLLHFPSELPEALERPESVASIRSYRVLLVDDNTDSNHVLEILLRIEGHEVSTVADGLTAVARIRDEAPDIVVCDIGLPGLDGYEVAETVCAQGGEARPTLIAVTGYGQAEDRARALAAGFDHHLVKPVDPALLIGLITDSKRGVRHSPE
jgi:CheY-like chemotaxis protein